MDNRRLARVSIFLPAALLLPLCSSSFAQCSLNTVRGTWGFQARGTAMMTVTGSSTPAAIPFASLGVMKVDYQGRFTGHGTTSVGGKVQDWDLPGSIQVNADCTATETDGVGPLQSAGRLVILDNGNEMREMATKHPLGPVIGIASYRRLAWGDAQCTSDMVRGVYGGTTEGTFMMSVSGQTQLAPTPASGMPTMTFYSGTGTGGSTASMAGHVVDFTFLNMSMMVNPDCTATLQWSAVSKQVPGQTFTGTIKYVVLNNGNELIGMETEDSLGLPISVQNLKRISVMPLASAQ